MGPGSASRPIFSEDREFALSAYRQMLLIRRFEQRCLDLSTSNPPTILGSIHLCAGQEAVPVGAMAALQPQDYVVATYRGHGWALSGRLDIADVFAEVCHKASGVNGGRAGSAMISAPWKGFIGENSIVGAGGPIACGAALSCLLRKTKGVALVSFGDGATSQGALHESLVFAAAMQLPVIFVCENNGWSELTESSQIIKVDRLAKRASGYGMMGVTIDGNDPLAVRDTVVQAADRARSGGGPSFIECRTPRLWGHYNRDVEHYRSKEDRAAAAANDPIPLLAQRLKDAGFMSDSALSECAVDVDRQMAAIEERVLRSAAPDPATARLHVTSTPAAAPNRAAPAASRTSSTETTYVGAVNEALRRILAEDPATIVYGEDVGKAGGIFGASRNLQREFGAERVFDTPIAEAAILGSAVGAALTGLRPIVEIMWSDFLLVALDQIINQAANVSYVTKGRASAPIVIRTQQGTTPGSCPQHSQSLEALLFHIPGLRIGMPATAQDAYDMLRAATASPDPVILIEARALYQRKESVDFRFEHHRSPAPLDTAALADVVSRCGGRALVVHEANLTGGVGAEIAARIVEHDGSAIVRRLATPDVRIPASPVLQAALLPGADAIAKAVRAIREVKIAKSS